MLRIYALIGVGIAAAALFVYVQMLRHNVERLEAQRDEIQATLTAERESHQHAIDEAEAQRARDLDEANRIQYEAITHIQERVHAVADAASALRLRLDAANRVRPLAAAASAPADCRNYAADPTRLSEQDREFLIGEAVAAESNVILIDACRADYKSVRVACGITE